MLIATRKERCKLKTKYLRRVLALLCVLCLCIPLALAEETVTPAPPAEPTPTPFFAPNVIPTESPVPTAAPVEGNVFLTHAVEISHRISLLAGNPTFMMDYSYDETAKTFIESLIRGDHTMPAQMYHVSGEELIRALYGENSEGMLDFTRPELRRDLVNSLPEILWGRREAIELSVLSHLSRYKAFADPDVEGCGFYVMLYGDATPILLTWYSEEGAVSVAAHFLPDEALVKCRTAEEVAAWFAGNGMPPVVFEEVVLK